MTKRVRLGGQTSGMTPERQERNLESCEAVLIGFSTHRFVIVRRCEPSHLRLAERAQKRIRDLQPGDRVFYKGQLQVIRSLEVYA